MVNPETAENFEVVWVLLEMSMSYSALSSSTAPVAPQSWFRNPEAIMQSGML